MIRINNEETEEPDATTEESVKQESILFFYYYYYTISFDFRYMLSSLRYIQMPLLRTQTMLQKHLVCNLGFFVDKDRFWDLKFLTYYCKCSIPFKCKVNHHQTFKINATKILMGSRSRRAHQRRKNRK